jgi:hypothetical protein
VLAVPEMRTSCANIAMGSQATVDYVGRFLRPVQAAFNGCPLNPQFTIPQTSQPELIPARHRALTLTPVASPERGTGLETGSPALGDGIAVPG